MQNMPSFLSLSQQTNPYISGWGVAEAKSILATAICVSVCLSIAAFLHYSTEPDITWRNGRGAL